MTELNEDGLVHLGICVGTDCIREHGTRIATWRGFGPSTIYIVCDDCFEHRLTPDERAHMLPVVGAERVRSIGLHELHDGRFVDGDLELARGESSGTIAADQLRELRTELAVDAVRGGESNPAVLCAKCLAVHRRGENTLCPGFVRATVETLKRELMAAWDEVYTARRVVQAAEAWRDACEDAQASDKTACELTDAVDARRPKKVGAS